MAGWRTGMGVLGVVFVTAACGDGGSSTSGTSSSTGGGGTGTGGAGVGGAGAGGGSAFGCADYCAGIEPLYESLCMMPHDTCVSECETTLESAGLCDHRVLDYLACVDAIPDDEMKCEGGQVIPVAATFCTEETDALGICRPACEAAANGFRAADTELACGTAEDVFTTFLETCAVAVDDGTCGAYAQAQYECFATLPITAYSCDTAGSVVAVEWGGTACEDEANAYSACQGG